MLGTRHIVALPAVHRGVLRADGMQCTVLRATRRSWRISLVVLIVLARTSNARRIGAIVSTPFP